MSEEEDKRLHSYDDLRGGQTLTVEDLEGAPRVFTVTAHHFKEFEDDEGSISTKSDLKLKETPLSFIANFTNRALLRAVFGDDPQAIVGHQIVLAPASTQYMGKRVPCIRVAGSPHLEGPREVVVKYKGNRKRPEKFELRPPPGSKKKAAKKATATAEQFAQALAAVEGATPETIGSILEQLRKTRWEEHQSIAIKKAADRLKG